jgi:hypothetical protein
VAVVLCMRIALAISVLGNLSFMPWRFKLNFTLLKKFNIEYILIVRSRLEVDKNIGSGSLVRYCLIFQGFATLCPMFSISDLMS